jgi:hypothetical protein
VKVLVDTCVWSAVLRRKSPDPELSAKIAELIEAGRVGMIGPVRQELLSGISDPVKFRNLKSSFVAFEDLPLRSDHYEKAAEFANICRKRGVQGSSIDFLICAVSSLEQWPVFTTDKDFDTYRKYLPIRLF